MEEEKKKIMVVLAHPDDESFGMGGTIALYSQQGVDVHLVCATRGEAGEVDPEFMEGFDTIAQRRESELRCAAGILGLEGLYFLDYRDSGMTGSKDNEHPKALVNAPIEDVAAKIVKHIRRVKPQVVVTFDPMGGYHHPDHIAIHHATVKAFYGAGDPGSFPNGQDSFQPEKLYYHVFPRGLVRVMVKLLKFLGRDVTKFGRNKDINLEVLAGDEDYPSHISINYRPVLDLKEQADACHASQVDFGGQSVSLLRWFRRMTSTKDRFMRAYPPTSNGFRADDLFED